MSNFIVDQFRKNIEKSFDDISLKYVIGFANKPRLEATHFIEQYKTPNGKILQTQRHRNKIKAMKMHNLEGNLHTSLVLGCKTVAIFKIKFK